MARVYSHRRGTTTKKAKPVEAIYASAISIASLVIYGVLLGFSVTRGGETAKWIGGTGVLGFTIAIAAFIYNVGQMRTATDLKERIICMTISSVALLIWLATMIIGMIS